MTTRPAPLEVLTSVATSLIEPGALNDGVLVDLDPSRRTKYLPRTILAAWIRDADVIGIWAIDQTSVGVGPIFALDGAAREYTNWGAAAKGDSKLEAERTAVLGYP